MDLFGETSEPPWVNLGTPSSEITHWLDVAPWLDQKLHALAAHRTQIDTSELLGRELTGDELLRYSREQYLRRPLPWDSTMKHHDMLDRARDEIGASALQAPGAH